MSLQRRNTNSLHSAAQFSLFVSSYSPLFILIIIKQVGANSTSLSWGGFNHEAIGSFLSQFGLSAFLALLTIFGWYGIYKTLNNVEEIAKNGIPISLKSVSNKNSESIGYIATYLIPFLFQSFSSFYECFSVIFLLAIIYKIYINSSLLLINPLLSMKYAIYEIEFEVNKKSKKGMAISKVQDLEDEAKVKLYEIGYKLFFAINNE